MLVTYSAVVNLLMNHYESYSADRQNCDDHYENFADAKVRYRKGNEAN